MDQSRAREVLGVNSKTTLEEVEAAFRKLASVHHPDKGGNADEMAEILSAREEILGSKTAGSGALIPIEEVRNLVRVIANQNEMTARTGQLKGLHTEFQKRSTNRLKARRKLAAIVAALAAAFTFFGKELPIEDVVHVMSGPLSQQLEQAKQELERNPPPAMVPRSDADTRAATPTEKANEMAYAKTIANRNALADTIKKIEGLQVQAAQIKSLLRVTSALLAMFLGMFAWMLSQQISRTEQELESFDENTENRAGFSEFLRRAFNGQIPTEWTELNLEQAVAYPYERWVHRLSSQLGPQSFARYVIRRGKALDFLASREVVQDGALTERFRLKMSTEPAMMNSAI